MDIPVADCLQSTWHGGTAAILTTTNEDALRMLGLLTKRGIPARLIQSGDGFRMSQLAEVKMFCKLLRSESDDNSPIIPESAWKSAKEQLRSGIYAASSCLETVLNMLSQFEAVSGEKLYRSDFGMFIFESAYETFTPQEQDAGTSSTRTERSLLSLQMRFGVNLRSCASEATSRIRRVFALSLSGLRKKPENPRR